MSIVAETVRKFLGCEVKDRVTDATGVVECVSFDLYGCIQAGVKPKVDKEGKQLDARWFDTSRLEITNDKPVMDLPAFLNDKHGPADKPAR
jgi:hypothetical protein